ncbi:MAG: O-antigen ligase family protein [Candidatus Omnitrophica bacterium]|nr:O-antigen ligase family protein [Candidatus Omnitrophota bacterium]
MKRLFLDPTPAAVEILVASGLFALPVSKAAAEVFLISALACWLLHKFATRTSPLPASPVTWIYSAFLAISLASFIQIPAALRPEGLMGILKWLKYLGIFFMCLDLYAVPQKRSRLFWILILSLVIVSIDGFWQLYTGRDLFFGYKLDPGRIVRMKASLTAANLLAGFLLFALPLSALACYRSRRWVRGLTGASFFLFLAAFFLTYSRGAFYAMALSLFLNLLLLRKIKIALAVTLFSILLVFSVPSFRYNFVKTLKKNDITIAERRDYWSVAFNMIKREPLLGVGLNTYHARFPDFTPDPGVRRAYPHNSYLQMASEIGIPGALCFLGGILYLLGLSFKKNFVRNDPEAFALRTALIAFLIQGFFDNNFYALQTATLFWVFGGVFSGLTLATQNGTGRSSSASP